MAQLKKLFYLTLLACICNAIAIVNIDPEKKERIDEFVNSLLFDCDLHQNVVGMNLAVVHGGEVLYTTGYGLRNIDNNEPVTEDTIFGIASVSKHFTTTLLGQTLRNSGYTWGTKVRDILVNLGTDFYFFDPLRSNLTSLRDLASHSVGISRNDPIWFLQNWSRGEVASRLRFLEGVQEPRTSFRYNNLMFTLQGHVTELLAGKNWEELMQRDVYNKVGMLNSSFVYLIDEETSDIATAYMVDEGTPREVEWQTYVDLGPDVGPAGGISSTANDMARWMNVLLSGGLNSEGERVFDSDVIVETQSPVNAFSSGQGSTYYPPEFPISYSVWSSYGLGMGPGTYRGYRTVAHGGALWGHYTHFILFPDIGLGIYSSINGVEGFPSAMENIALFVADVILGQDPWLNTTTACDFPFPTAKSSHKDVEFTAGTGNKINPDAKRKFAKEKTFQYLGQYGNFAYGNLTVNVDDVQFDEDNIPSQFLDVTFTYLEGAVRFERGLLFEDAPGPTEHWPQCEEA